MTKTVIQLYPHTGESVALQGLYLRRSQLAQLNSGAPSIPHVYANFLTSLDGRIALKSAHDEHYQLPPRLKSEADFMLLLELYAQADCIITHGGYMRALAEDRLGNILQIPSTPQTEYIRAWREQQSMQPNPDVVIVSGSLDFPWHASLDQSGQTVHIASGGQASADKHQQWAQAGHTVHRLGDENHVDVDQLMTLLQDKGYQSVYLMAGPDLLQAMLERGMVERFFVTMSHQLLAGDSYKTLLDGEPLGDRGHMRLQAMYMDAGAENTPGQWYAEFSFEHR